MSKSAQAAEPISAQEARHLFAGWQHWPALVLAVSGGPDSVALLWLAARWRKALKNGPALTAVTVDHGLRAESAAEARHVKRIASELGIAHRTLRWRGEKPDSGVPEAARDARYDLLVRAARSASAPAIVTAHTQDDQAETIVMRVARGSGLAGLGGIMRRSRRDELVLLRPLLGVPKARLIATLDRAKIDFVNDPSNIDPAYTRPRIRALMPALAAEGADARSLARLGARLARAHAALDLITDGAARYLGVNEPRAKASAGSTRPPGIAYRLHGFLNLAEELQVRLLIRALSDPQPPAKPPELGKVEALLAALMQAGQDGGDSKPKGLKPSRVKQPRFKQSLAGKTVGIERDLLVIRPAPPRRPVSRTGPRKP